MHAGDMRWARAAGLAVLLGALPARAGAPALLGAYTSGIEAWHVRLPPGGAQAYVAGFKGYPAFQAIAVTNPSSPTLQGTLTLPQSGDRLALSGDGRLACMVGSAGGTRVIAMTNPAAPALLAVYDNGNSHPRDVVLSSDGARMFVADDAVGVEVVSLTIPSAPVRIGLYTNLSGGVAALALTPDEAHLVLAAEYAGLVVLAVTNPASPQFVGQFPLPGGSGPLYAVTTAGDGSVAYAAGEGGPDVPAVYVVSLTNATAPALLARFLDHARPGTPTDLVLSPDGSTLFVAGNRAGLRIYDVSLATGIVDVAEFFEPINDEDPQVSGVALSPDGRVAVLAAGVYGLRLVDVAGVYDRDGDGLPNAWELRYFGSIEGAEPEPDPDGDGYSNEQEFVAGSHPRDSNSVFRITAVQQAPDARVGVPSLAGRRYDLDVRSALEDTNAWASVAGSTNIAGTGADLWMADGLTPDAPRFYRVRVRLGD